MSDSTCQIGGLTRIPKLLMAILRNFLGINGLVEVHRVVKIRLTSHQPFLLQALAQSHPIQHRSSGLKEYLPKEDARTAGRPK